MRVDLTILSFLCIVLQVLQLCGGLQEALLKTQKPCSLLDQALSCTSSPLTESLPLLSPNASDVTWDYHDLNNNTATLRTFRVADLGVIDVLRVVLGMVALGVLGYKFVSAVTRETKQNPAKWDTRKSGGTKQESSTKVEAQKNASPTKAECTPSKRRMLKPKFSKIKSPVVKISKGDLWEWDEDDDEEDPEKDNLACSTKPIKPVTLTPSLASQPLRTKKPCPETPPGTPPEILIMETAGAAVAKEIIWQNLIRSSNRPCFTEKRGFIGEDFSRYGHNIATVADGVGSFGYRGLDASLAAEHYACYTFYEMTQNGLSPLRAVHAAHERMDMLVERAQQQDLPEEEWALQGATTLLLYQVEGTLLKYYEIGDCALVVYRPGLGLIHHTRYAQFASADGLATWQLGPHSPCSPDHGDTGEMPVKQGDCIIAGSDGFFDNICEHQVLQCIDSVTKAVKEQNRISKLNTVRPHILQDMEEGAESRLFCKQLYSQLKACVRINVHDQHMQDMCGCQPGVFKGADDVTIHVSRLCRD